MLFAESEGKPYPIETLTLAIREGCTQAYTPCSAADIHTSRFHTGAANIVSRQYQAGEQMYNRARKKDEKIVGE